MTPHSFRPDHATRQKKRNEKLQKLTVQSNRERTRQDTVSTRGYQAVIMDVVPLFNPFAFRNREVTKGTKIFIVLNKPLAVKDIRTRLTKAFGDL